MYKVLSYAYYNDSRKLFKVIKSNYSHRIEKQHINLLVLSILAI